MPTLQCLPRSICSQDFKVRGASAGAAVVAFNYFTEQGEISLGQNQFAVRKHGPFSGRWTLEEAGQTLVTANKPNALFRSFELQAGGADFTVKAQSAFRRGFDIISRETTIGVIRPAHPFTRRAFIECAAEMPELAQLFAFWLVALTWRRAAKNSVASQE